MIRAFQFAILGALLLCGCSAHSLVSYHATAGGVGEASIRLGDQVCRGVVGAAVEVGDPELLGVQPDPHWCAEVRAPVLSLPLRFGDPALRDTCASLLDAVDLPALGSGSCVVP